MTDHEIARAHSQSAAPDVKVSVLMTAYNQEQFIAQAVNSALMQETDFPFEVVISEDYSSDQTRQLVLDLQAKSPEIIRVLLRDQATAARDRSLGMGGKTAFMAGLRACRGQYVALLDGDDYWINKEKLQKQVDFLETHAHCSACFHDALAVSDDVTQPSRNVCPVDQKEFSTIAEILDTNFVPPASVLFRRGLFGELPGWFTDIVAGDWAVHVLNADRGLLGYLPEVMAVYRVHANSFWSRRERREQLEEIIRTYEVFDKHFNYKYHRAISQSVSKLCDEVAATYENRGDVPEAKIYARRALTAQMKARHFPRASTMRTLLSLYTPTLYKVMRNLRRALRST